MAVSTHIISAARIMQSFILYLDLHWHYREGGIAAQQSPPSPNRVQCIMRRHVPH
ncbi:unnamed protein product [Ixodes persulcatus]